MSNVLDKQEAALQKYLERVEQLYTGIAPWFKDWGWDDTRRQTLINEERHGVYDAPVLVLRGP